MKPLACRVLALLLPAAPTVALAQEVPFAQAPAETVSGGGLGSTAGRVARLAPPLPLTTRGGESGILFELHGNYYKILGRTNIYSADVRFDAARQRLYQLFKQEWSGYQGILRTGAYASNDALAHLVAGKQVELLSDQQVTTLVAKHLPEEAHRLLPAQALAALPLETPAAGPAVRAAALRGADSAAASEAAAFGPLGLAAVVLSGGLLWWWWTAHPTLPAAPGGGAR